MKGFLTAVASLLSLIVTAGVALACVLVLAGPHSDILPSWLQSVVFILGWAAVIGVPIAVGRFTWRRLHQSGVAQQAVGLTTNVESRAQRTER
jgi:hypothetical protein